MEDKYEKGRGENIPNKIKTKLQNKIESHLTDLFKIVSFPAGVCPPGWEEKLNKCYLFIRDDDNPETKSEAETTCQEKNGRLLEIQSDPENDYIADKLRTMYDSNSAWVDCSDIGAEGNWMCSAGHTWTIATTTGAYVSKYYRPVTLCVCIKRVIQKVYLFLPLPSPSPRFVIPCGYISFQ